ncbi:MAG: hypothetical protein ACK5LJ_08345 [Paracoccus sp. (in: a-proteobacteria)]
MSIRGGNLAASDSAVVFGGATSGRYIQQQMNAAGLGLTGNSLYGSPPLRLARSVTFDALAVNLSTAGIGTSMVVRAGLYLLDPDTLVGTLLVDAGTADASTTGTKVLLASGTIPANTWYVSVLVAQGTYTTPPACATSHRAQFAHSAAAFSTAVQSALGGAAGVPGALPASITFVTSGGVGPQIAVRVA